MITTVSSLMACFSVGDQFVRGPYPIALGPEALRELDEVGIVEPRCGSVGRSDATDASGSVHTRCRSR